MLTVATSLLVFLVFLAVGMNYSIDSLDVPLKTPIFESTVIGDLTRKPQPPFPDHESHASQLDGTTAVPYFPSQTPHETSQNPEVASSHHRVDNADATGGLSAQSRDMASKAISPQDLAASLEAMKAATDSTSCAHQDQERATAETNSDACSSGKSEKIDDDFDDFFGQDSQSLSQNVSYESLTCPMDASKRSGDDGIKSCPPITHSVSAQSCVPGQVLVTKNRPSNQDTETFVGRTSTPEYLTLSVKCTARKLSKLDEKPPSTPLSTNLQYKDSDISSLGTEVDCGIIQSPVLYPTLHRNVRPSPVVKSRVDPLTQSLEEIILPGLAAVHIVEQSVSQILPKCDGEKVTVNVQWPFNMP